MASGDTTSRPNRTGSVPALLLTVWVTAIGVLPVAGQAADTTAWRFPIGQVASAAAGMSLSLVPRTFNINEGLPSCAPCDLATLPNIDRWAATTQRSAWDVASSVGGFGLVATTWYGLYNMPNGRKHLAVSVEAAAWNFGMTRLAKAVFNRNRPILYTEDAIGAQEDVASHRSMYSGHTSSSFVLATSYVLSMSHKKGIDRFWPLIVATGGQSQQ